MERSSALEGRASLSHRKVILFFLGFVVGTPLASTPPSKTSRAASSGRTSDTSSSRPMRPFSTVCRAATVHIILDWDASQKTVSIVAG